MDKQTKRGAHIESLVHPPTLAEVKELLHYGKGSISMITLAPEVCDQEIIKLIQSEEISNPAGHSNANFEQAKFAFDQGINAVTHLFNAMTTLDHRSAGLPVATMLDDTAMASIIADGYHVNYRMVEMVKKLMGSRLFLITDAVTEATEGPYPHKLHGDRYLANNILSGSALTLLKAVKNVVAYAGITLQEAFRMASLYPAKVLGLENNYGRLATGYEAKFICLDKDLNIC